MYHWFNNSEKEVKKHIVEYVKLINADGKIHNEEIQHLVNIAEKHGMKDSEIKTLISGLGKDTIKTPETDDERFDHLFYLVNLVLTDSVLNPEEIDFCKEIAGKIGYPIANTSAIIKEMYSGIKKEQPATEIKANIQKLL